jgi:hypothetical protein
MANFFTLSLYIPGCFYLRFFWPFGSADFTESSLLVGKVHSYDCAPTASNIRQTQQTVNQGLGVSVLFVFQPFWYYVTAEPQSTFSQHSEFPPESRRPQEAPRLKVGGFTGRPFFFVPPAKADGSYCLPSANLNHGHFMPSLFFRFRVREKQSHPASGLGVY